MEPIQIIQHNGYTIKIFVDDDPQNPRTEFEHLGKILYTSSRYDLGDERVLSCDIEDVVQREDVIVLPVYAYIHSGIVLSTSEFSCKWDSGQSGIIYCEIKDAKAEYPDLEGEELDKVVREILKAEVEEFSKYLSGEVYEYTVTEPTGINESSCWGIYNIEDAIEDAKAFAENTPIPQVCITFEGTETCVGTGGASCQT